ncbi:hypothetical protein [Paenibacillus sp. SN-8-1]|uniref:hypothetical protein n=1 Tax=Paenibacillus sp. SN-8-1 TaxID=3435409 RepID=UPI003D9A7A1B
MSALFSFLDKVSEGLLALSAQAETDIWTNPRSTLTQGRLFSEELAITVSRLEKVEPVYSIKHSERVHKLYRDGLLSEEVKASFEWLRLNGNKAAHDTTSIPVDLALSAHRHIYVLATWYVETYGDLSIKPPVYQMPSMPSNQSAEMFNPVHSIYAMGDQLEQMLNEQIVNKILPTINDQFKYLQETITKVADSFGDRSPLKEKLTFNDSNEQTVYEAVMKESAQALTEETTPDAGIIKRKDAHSETEFEQDIRSQQIVFPASMANLELDDLKIKGYSAILNYLRNELNVRTIKDLPEDLSFLSSNMSGVGPKTVSKFIQQLDNCITEEKRLMGSGKRKVNAITAFRELKNKLGRRPKYMELHTLGSCDSQDYRQLFGSYHGFLWKANELNKTEASLAKRYENWLNELESTKMSKSYKMVVLYYMLERGPKNWTRSVTAYEVAPFFYDYYMKDENRKSIDFSNDESRKLWDEPLIRTARLIARMPMTVWGTNNKFFSYAKGELSLSLKVREEDLELLHEWTREVCEYRLFTYFERKREI